VRPYRPEDRPALADICVRTGDAGEDARALYSDANGSALVTRLLDESPAHLSAGGRVLAELDPAMVDRFEALRAFLMALGDDVQETTLRFYIAFKRIKNFACVSSSGPRRPKYSSS